MFYQTRTFAAAAAVTLACQSLAIASEEKAKEQYDAYTNAWAYSLAGPSKDHMVVAKFGPCNRFKIVAQENGYLKVFRGGYRGWISKQKLVKANPCASSKKRSNTRD